MKTATMFSRNYVDEICFKMLMFIAFGFLAAFFFQTTMDGRIGCAAMFFILNALCFVSKSSESIYALEQRNAATIIALFFILITPLALISIYDDTAGIYELNIGIVVIAFIQLIPTFLMPPD